METNKKAVIQVYEVETKNGGALESVIDEGLSDRDVVCACALLMSKITKGKKVESIVGMISNMMNLMLEWYLRGN
jgi:hypothetical protein